jgi:tRNA pseudouridine55 synthase
MSHCGLLILNKPVGMTSRQAVNAVARLARPARTGHAGTLDPLATGVLVVAIGAATRLIGYVQQMPKRYVGTFLLGRRSASDDIEMEVVELADPPVPTREEIVAATRGFLGRIAQRPPAFSAIKVAGRRAYDLARRGREVELPARPVEIRSIDVVDYRYPELILDISCGSGTYIRSLGRDLAESLGTAAVMSGLCRTAIGDFRLDAAIDPHDLRPEDWEEQVRPATQAVARLPRLVLSAADVKQLQCGQRVTIRPEPSFSAINTELAAVNSTGELVGIVIADASGLLRTVRNMPTP